MTRNRGLPASTVHLARRDEHRRMARWVTAAVWRHRLAPDSLTAATVVSDALEALGVDNRVASAAVLVESPTLPAKRLFGRAAPQLAALGPIEPYEPDDHAVVVAKQAGVLLDAAFDRFGTRVPYLVAAIETEAEAHVHRAGSATVTFLQAGREHEVGDDRRGLVLAQALEVAGVGSQVAFDADALLYAEQPLFPSWDRLRGAIDDADGEPARLLAAFRASRDEHLVALGYPWSLQDPFTSPSAIAMAG